MSSTPLSSIGLVMPAWFNSQAHDRVHSRLVPYKDTHFAEWMSFGIAWKAVAYRSKAAAAYHDRFTESIRRSNSPLPDERYEQEHSLFGFFSSALSSLECYYYALYCIGAIVDPAAFPAASPKDLRVHPVNVADRFSAAFPNDPLTTVMHSIISDAMFNELGDIRNVLSHRGAPPRHFFQGGENHGKAMIPSNPKAPAAQWVYSLELNERTTEHRWNWVSASLSTLLSAAEVFCGVRLVVA